MVVGQNPSAKEYAKGFLSNDRSILQRRKTQLTYFEHDENYAFFAEIRKFFGGEVKERMKWIDSPWERVAYLDLVKCPTTCAKGQWSKLSAKQQELLIMNCQDYLKEQLRFYKPKIILPYGADVGRWFASHLNVEYEEYENRTAQLDDRVVYLLFIPQRQGPHTIPEISWIQNKMLRILEQSVKPSS